MEDRKFILIFWFCVGSTFCGLLLLAAIIFCPIPKENQQTANVALGFLTGTLITGAIGYLLGGNPTSKKPEPTVQQTGDSPTTIIQPKTEQPENKIE
jgi:hypothetical protein